MPDIYELHDKAFSSVSAYVIAKDGERVATIAFKFPKDGAGRLYAYVHFFGLQMQRGHASGCGYDKRSAAIADVFRLRTGRTGEKPFPLEGQPEREKIYRAFSAALAKDDGEYWNNRLADAGFDVWQAV